MSVARVIHTWIGEEWLIARQSERFKDRLRLWVDIAAIGRVAPHVNRPSREPGIGRSGHGAVRSASPEVATISFKSLGHTAEKQPT